MPRFRTVLFDCDSTLSAIEGIDELAVHCRDDVEQLTDAAMRGRIPLEEVYGRRLQLGREYVARLVPDAADAVAALHAAGVEVRIISGGLLPAVLAVARAVGVDAGRVAAVDIRFNADGSYAGFDTTSALTMSGGKLTTIERWAVDRPAMMVGDGTTDLEAKPAVDFFLAFAGVVERPNVVNAADAVVRANSLAPVLPLVLNADELLHTSHHTLYERGVALNAAVSTR
jgi:phosphoserine phosphatase